MDEMNRKRLTAKLSEEQMSLPFDQHQRYRLVADVVERLRQGPGPLRVLDVGGGEGVIQDFLPEDDIIILDQTEAGEIHGFVKGDATALPFEDEAFDYVVSVDVYEHIAPRDRDKYLSELWRVARRGVLLAAPFDSEAVRGAERAANEFHRAIHLQENMWLKEHAENGLPRLEEARRFFQSQGDTVKILPNGYLPHWLAMICLTFYSPKLADETGNLFECINAFYNESMYEIDNAEPCYRYLLASLKELTETGFEELALPDTTANRTALSAGLFSTLSTVVLMEHKDAQVASLSRQLKQREGDLARKEAQVERHSTKVHNKDAQVAKLSRQLKQREGSLARKEAQVDDLSRRLAQQVSEAKGRQIQVEQHSAKMRNLERHRDQLQKQLEAVTGSRVWRLLSLQRRFRNWAKRAVRRSG